MLNCFEGLADEYFTMDQSVSRLMSDLYHNIAEENYADYHIHQSALKRKLKVMQREVQGKLEYAVNEILSNEESLSFFRENYVHHDSSSLTDLLVNVPNEAINNSNVMLELLAKTQTFKEFELPVVSNEFEIASMNLIKAGMTAIAFEAFACEALINLKLLEFMTKKEVKYFKSKKGDRRPAYIRKLEKIITKRNIDTDVDKLNSELTRIMQSRNEIVHFKGFEIDYLDFFSSIEAILNEDTFRNLYMCDIFGILESPLEIYSSLREILS